MWQTARSNKLVQGATSEWFLRGLIFLGLFAATFGVYMGFNHGDEARVTVGHRPLIRVHIDTDVGSATTDSGGSRATPPRQQP